MFRAIALSFVMLTIGPGLSAHAQTYPFDYDDEERLVERVLTQLPRISPELLSSATNP